MDFETNRLVFKENTLRYVTKKRGGVGLKSAESNAKLFLSEHLSEGEIIKEIIQNWKAFFYYY